jgi:hypothetical protein
MKVELSITDTETIREYEENGVCVVRNVLGPEWITRMGDATDRILANPCTVSFSHSSGKTQGRVSPLPQLLARQPTTAVC